MITIRKYEEKDHEDMRFICLNADGPDEVPDDSMSGYFTTVYCDYFIEQEPENCFVLDDSGRAVGFIISTENYSKYKKTFDEIYLPRIKVYGETHYNWASHSADEQGSVKEKYPAHFHINILPEYQRMGYGAKLIDTLLSHLAEKGIKGVCLTCWGFSKNAIAFYKKLGFSLISADDNGEYLFAIETDNHLHQCKTLKC